MDLPISRLIKVDVNLAPKAAQAQDLSTLLVLDGSSVIDVHERLRTYSTIDQVAADFGVNADAYKAAVLWFEQAPQPTAIKVGRWAATPTQGKLVCAPLAAANLLPATWAAINNGNFSVDINGVTVPVNGVDFTGVANLNAVADKITAAMAGATCVYDAVYQRFEFESAAAGVGSSISFLSAGAATDISGMLGGQALQGGYVADGIDAETAVAAATLFDAQFGQTWYALQIPGGVDADHLAVAAYVEASNNKHIYGVTTQDPASKSSVSVTDIGYLLKAAGYRRTTVQYSSSNGYAVASLLGRILTTDYNGQNTVITLMYKDEPGITAESLTESDADALQAKNVNVFVAYNNDTAIVQYGTMASGDYVDEVTGTDWLAVTLMTALYNVLFTSPTKIPQTDQGIHTLVTTCESVCSQAANNGLLGEGIWNSNGFGTLASGDFLPKGFYVYAAPVASQSQADRAARKAPPIQIAAKLAGAVHSVDVTINVNR